MIKKLLQSMNTQKQSDRDAEIYRNLIRSEARVGGTVFGDTIPLGGRREFFCLDERTWVWHEEWIDAIGQHRSRTTRYDIRPGGALKAQSDGQYHALSPEESHRLRQAIELYYERVKTTLYGAIA